MKLLINFISSLRTRDFESREESFGDLMRAFERRNNKGFLRVFFINLMRSLEDFQ
jgi:hypothetical protein